MAPRKKTPSANPDISVDTIADAVPPSLPDVEENTERKAPSRRRSTSKLSSSESEAKAAKPARTSPAPRKRTGGRRSAAPVADSAATETAGVVPAPADTALPAPEHGAEPDAGPAADRSPDAAAHNETAAEAVIVPEAGDIPAVKAEDANAPAEASTEEVAVQGTDTAAGNEAEPWPIAAATVPESLEAEAQEADQPDAGPDASVPAEESSAARKPAGQRSRSTRRQSAGAADSPAQAKPEAPRKRSAGRKAVGRTAKESAAALETPEAPASAAALPAEGTAAGEHRAAKPSVRRKRKTASPLPPAATGELAAGPEAIEAHEAVEIAAAAAESASSAYIAESVSAAEAAGGLQGVLDRQLKKKDRKQTHEKDGVYIRKDLKERLDQAAEHRSKGFKTLLLNYGLEKALDELEQAEALNRIKE
ncbi:hypothetical protein [Paenibacillus puerhi]|uniref:hypothetical protein n=1 Tax=Paenibacillus puerhi TaxID=2692622 RepID=UPI00135CA14C|nr:hypothetical protein [Paenibacillus puerhi]